MRKLFLSVLILVVCAGMSSAAQAQIEKYLFDDPHTQVIFAVSHLGYADSYGKFLDYDGHIMFDRGEPEKSSVEFTIRTDSVDMGDQKWNDHLKNEDFFNVEKYPVMTFKSTDIEVTGDDTAKITGDLTILDVTKPVTLDVTHNKSGKHPMMDRMEAGFSARTTIKRSDFGMNYGLPNVGDEVDIILEVEAYKEDPTAEGTENQ